MIIISGLVSYVTKLVLRTLLATGSDIYEYYLENNMGARRV